MHIAEMDFRLSCTMAILTTLDRGCCELLEKAGQNAADYVEDHDAMLGIGFIAVQTYIAGTIADLKRVFPARPIPADLFRRHSVLIPSTSLTQVEGIWAIANFVKHSDEWMDSDRKGRSATRDQLTQIGVTKWGPTVCNDALTRIVGEWDGLKPLLGIARGWREAWFAELHGESA